MENPIIRIAAKFQYKNPSLPTLAVMDTISWSLGRLHRKSRTFLQRSWIRKAGRSWCEHFSRQLVMKTVQWNVIYYYCWWFYDTYYCVYLSSDHPFEVYYKVRQLILLSAIAFFYKVRQVVLQSATDFTKCNDSIAKCDRYYKVRQNRWVWKRVSWIHGSNFRTFTNHVTFWSRFTNHLIRWPFNEVHQWFLVVAGLLLA